MRTKNRAHWPLLLLLAAMPVQAQQKPTLRPAEYGQFENLGAGVLSPDGQWLAYTISRVDGTTEVRVHRNGERQARIFANATRGVFSNNSAWLALEIGHSEAQREQMTKDKKPIRNRAALLNLATGDTISIADISSFAFSDDGGYIALRGYAPEGRKSKGADLAVRDLARATMTNFGNVADFRWREKGTLLALTIDTENQTGNAVAVYDPAAGSLRTLDSSPARYTAPAWRDDDDDLAVLRTAVSEAYEDTAHVVMAWKDLASPRTERLTFDPATANGFPRDMRIVDSRPLRWSDNGRTVFFGIQAREPKESKTTVVAADSAASRTKASGNGGRAADEPAGVEVWHAKDIDIMPEQKVRANRDRNRNFLAAWHAHTNRFVQLADDFTEEVVAIEGDHHALGHDQTPYDRDRMFGPVYRDVYVIDVATGEKRKVNERLENHMGTSPGGRYSLYLEKDHYFVYDIRTGTHTNLTKNITTSFVNTDDDHTVDQKPPYGVAGFTRGDASVLLYDKYDVWEVPLGGGAPRRLTNGAEQQLRYRYIRLDADEPAIDPTRPLYLSMTGEKTKKSGYARVQPGRPVEPLVWMDANIGRLMKAKSAETYAYVVQSFTDSPDWFVAGPALKDARQVSETNPQQNKYAWGRTELITYRNTQGKELQGSLIYPANYEPGKKYPMIVYIYEIMSTTHHNYMVPSERGGYNQQVWSQDGYFVLRPDIVYRDRNPGLSAVDALVPAVDAVVARYDVDAGKVGLIGHSWGGYQTTFVPTQTNRFAAAVAGAPLTDMISMYLSIYWNTGGTDARIFEISQGRMEVPPWEDMDAYTKNSAVFNITRLNTPMLMTFGDKDGAVDWHQGIELYNAARRAQKDLVMLVYEGENHSLAKKPNQLDYHRRVNEWFAHYLKGEPAAKWITEGVRFLDREKELKRLRKADPPKPIT